MNLITFDSVQAHLNYMYTYKILEDFYEKKCYDSN